MPRYFLELAYKGTHYSGFQVQQNAVTIQSEVEKALGIYFSQQFSLTGSSRTDAGVHALQNYFHFDTDASIHTRQLYNINAILPADITVKAIQQVADTAHARFDALSREYKYFIYKEKNPFLQDRAWFYPYAIDQNLLNQAAQAVLGTHDFTSFAKKNTQVTNHICNIQQSQWLHEGDCLVYNVKANRFLRGMVKGLVGTMLRVGRGILSIDGFNEIVQAKDCTKADFTTPAQGLFLTAVTYPQTVLHLND
jgi:tRNA pseudouridine38-40 synthase